MSLSILLGLRLLAAILLYAFVGYVFYLMWRTLQEQANNLSEQGRAPIKLGMTASDGKEKILVFTQPEFFVGREFECDLCVDDSTISGRHARISFHHGHWWVEDLGSKNGTSLNENPLTMPTIITNGDTITCGNTALRVILSD
jgi:predicted component of type VI protein secretion system